MRWSRTAVVTIALWLAACAPSVSMPSPSANATVAPSAGPQGGRYPVACVNLADAECELVRAAAEGALGPAPAIASMMVQGFYCPGGAQGCPDGLTARPEGAPLVETADGRLWHVPVSLVDGKLVVGDPAETPSAHLTPSSARAGGLDVAFALGHCGLASPIDADGSLWDPVGLVDGDHPSFINSADGRLRFTGLGSAEFRTADGFIVSLARRGGGKSYALCD